MAHAALQTSAPTHALRTNATVSPSANAVTTTSIHVASSARAPRAFPPTRVAKAPAIQRLAVARPRSSAWIPRQPCAKTRPRCAPSTWPARAPLAIVTTPSPIARVRTARAAMHALESRATPRPQPAVSERTDARLRPQARAPPAPAPTPKPTRHAPLPRTPRPRARAPDSADLPAAVDTDLTPAEQVACQIAHRLPGPP